jgi:hypothetical protein
MKKAPPRFHCVRLHNGILLPVSPRNATVQKITKTFPETAHFFLICLRIEYMSGQSGRLNGKGSGNMRKFIAVTITLLMVAAMLSTGALAENGKEHKGGAGAGKGQNQSQAVAGDEGKGNSHGLSHADGKPAAEDTKSAADDDAVSTAGEDNEIAAGEDSGNEEGIAGEDSGIEDETPGQVKENNKENNKGNKPDENKPDEKKQEGPNHGNAYGRVRNTQEVLNDIGLLTGEETAAQLSTLMTAYREAKDTETAKTALAALLDALTQSCTVSAAGENGEATETQDQLALMEMAKLREKVLANAGNDNGTLLALMHAYENALRIMNHLEPIDDPEEETETDTVQETVPAI